MKVELATVAALAATVSAVPLRIITLTGPAPHLAPADVAHGLPHAHGEATGEMRIMPHPQPHPCSGKNKSPFSDLFTRLGLTRPNPSHGHEHSQWLDSAVHHAHHGEEKGNMLIEGWKHHVEEMFGGGKGKKIVPIMEGGSVRILPFLEGDQAEPAPEHKYGHGHHQHTGGKHLRPHGGHHWRHKSSSFGSRLHRAMLHLSPPEAITLAFVLGAGIGSIMHLIFMVFLISIRRIRGAGAGHMTCAERRQARRERRAARKAAKAAKKQGRIRLEGRDEVEQEQEVLPSYAEGESDRLVEKA